MMAASFSRRDRRTLMLGLGVTVGILLVARGLPLWLQARRTAFGESTEARAQLAELGAIIRRARIVDELVRLQSVRYAGLEARLIGGSTREAAAADFASWTSNAIAESGLRLGSLRLETDAASVEAFNRVAVRVEVTGDITGITRFLRVIERTDTLVVVSAITLGQPEPAATDSQPEAIHGELVIETLTWSRSKP
jgi:hypothetical protein